MPDVYGDGHDVEDEYVCVMEYFEEDASTTYYATLKGNREENDEVVPFCTSCKNTLTSMIPGCFHAGNQV
ncbi:MAG: hypothetical protein J6D31_10330 [Clostridia bacterium]|nr:hypothetical protein [Clostridia bacterium]